MAVILRKLFEAYQVLFDELPDERTKDWFLVAKPIQILTLLGVYLMFVLKWGPKWMRHREPFNLDKLLIVYNAAQVIACVHIFVNALWLAWGWKYKWICEPVDFSNSENALKIASFVYMYLIMKVVDLMDTVFFVLRKKANQVSFLHIYHHTGMVLLVWGTITYLPGGHGTLVGVINSFVHIVMYSYYLYTVINPAAKQSIWWKKHITQLQILQFFWCVVHMTFIVFKPDCEYPRWTAAVFLPQNIFILVLFLDFYIRTYIRKPKANKNNKHTKECNKNGMKSSLNGTSVTVMDSDNQNGEIKLQKHDLNYKNGTFNGNVENHCDNNKRSNGIEKNGATIGIIDKNGSTKENIERNGSASEENRVIIKGNGHMSDKCGKIE